jgi:hypothetical protein
MKHGAERTLLGESPHESAHGLLGAEIGPPCFPVCPGVSLSMSHSDDTEAEPSNSRRGRGRDASAVVGNHDEPARKEGILTA